MKSAKSTKSLRYEERFGHEEQEEHEEHEERLYARLPDITVKPRQAFAYAVDLGEGREAQRLWRDWLTSRNKSRLLQ